MFIDFKDLEKPQVYRFLTHTVVPRPVAWVLTRSQSTHYNIAPFSYFNIVCSDPGIMMISVGHKQNGSRKDTWKNLESSTDAVVHIADSTLLGDVNQSAKPIPHERSELDEINAVTVEQPDFALPRISSAPVALNCKRHDIHLIGHGPQAVIYLEIVSAFVSDDLKMNAQCQFDEKVLDPIARLGGDHYSLLGDIHTLKRP